VVEPSRWEKRAYAPGEGLSFHLLLAGCPLADLPFIALDGVMGEWRLRGDLASFLPFLHLGQ
jgi:hypothetical protein